MVSNPFQAGDVVELKAAGATVIVRTAYLHHYPVWFKVPCFGLARALPALPFTSLFVSCLLQLGRVEQVAPFRCTFVPLTDKKVPITIPNAEIIGLQISNRSRIYEQVNTTHATVYDSPSLGQ